MNTNLFSKAHPVFSKTAAWVIGVTLSASNLAAQPSTTAWQQLAAEAPGEALTVSPEERQMLQVLTPEQAQAYAAGQDPSAILLPNGETGPQILSLLGEAF